MSRVPRAKAFTVYRLFNASGELLYAGCSCDASQRLVAHHTRDWFNEVTSASFDHFETAKQASEAERTAILAERPKYNGCVGHYAKQVSGPRGRIDHLNPTEATLIDTHRSAMQEHERMYKVFELQCTCDWSIQPAKETLAA
jgi:hypothetical protein